MQGMPPPQIVTDTVLSRVQEHFEPHRIEDLVTIERVFPASARPDLEDAVENLLTDAQDVAFSGISTSRFGSQSFSGIVTDLREPTLIVAPQYMDIDTGGETSGRCVAAAIWFFRWNGGPAALLVGQLSRPYETKDGLRVELVMSPAAGGRDEGQALLARLAKHLAENSVYRGQSLSFETERSAYGGLGTLKVHRLPKVSLDQVILPARTLDVLRRTVFGFIETRDALRAHGFSTNRGLLLYGPPGTGKTHFIRYILSEIEGHTALLVTAEQVAFFDQIMAIARALQPAIVIIEDADLLARAREDRNGDCSQALLNSLLNHMDGLTEEAEILFVLTTNRPETLEEAVRDRPGRIDQAIEIPKPDAECRRRLLELYRGTMEIVPEVVDECVNRTGGASAAFLRELARRMAQFSILRRGTKIEDIDMTSAFDEMLNSGNFTAAALGANDPAI